MNRRKAIQVVATTALLTSVSAQAKMNTSEMNRINMQVKDPKNIQKGELKHSPEINLQGKDAKGYTLVSITVGQEGVLHPSTPDHWIDFISLSADGTLVGKVLLEPEISRGASLFAVKLDNVQTLTATAGCNLHGIWTSTLKV